MKLGLSLIVKNEEYNLKKNFLNICDSFDSIVVVDTGSVDGTVNLLKKNGISPIEMLLDKDNRYSLIEARNLSIKKNNADWVMVLDADERISIEDILVAREYIQKNYKENIGGYFLPFSDYRYGNMIFEDYKLCILKKDVFFEGYVHANPQSFIRKRDMSAEMIWETKVNHFPTTFSKEKNEHYIAQILFGLEKDKANARYLWFLGYSLYKHGDLSKAKEYLELSLILKSIDYPVESLNAGMVLSHIYTQESDFINAFKIINLTINLYFEMMEDFEVKINIKLKDTLMCILDNIKRKNNNSEVYEFIY